MSRGFFIAVVTASLVMALNTTRLTWVVFLIALRLRRASSRCQLIASPSRSGSVARIRLSSSFNASAMARMCFWLSGATSHFISKSCSGVHGSVLGRQVTDMAVGRQNGVVVSEVFIDGFGFGRGFYNDYGHIISL